MAVRKKVQGDSLNREDERALDRYERARDLDDLHRLADAVPQGVFLRWIGPGRQTKQLQDHERQYGIPVARATISVIQVVKAYYDFLARNAHRLSPLETDDPLLAGESTPGLERYRNAAADLKELDVATRREELVDRATVRENLLRIGAIIRGAGERIQRLPNGAAAFDLLDRALDDVEAYIERRLAAPSPGMADREGQKGE